MLTLFPKRNLYLCAVKRNAANQPDMKRTVLPTYLRHTILLLLTLSAMTARAQEVRDDKKIARPDSIDRDYEEWLRNEPIRPQNSDSNILQPMPPSDLGITDPLKAEPNHPKVSPDLVIMNDKMRTDMQLAYQSGWLERERQAQKGSMPMVGINPVNVAVMVIKRLIFGKNHKSKKQRRREQMQRILEEY